MMILFLTIIFVAIIAHNNAFSTTSTTTAAIFRTKKLSKLSNNLLYRLSMSSSESKITEIFLSPKEDKEVVIPNYDDETEEERYKRTKLAEIAEKQALEVFVSRNTGKWECQSCGYIYAEAKGNEKYNIKAGTPFDQIEKFRCPQCGANKKYFIAETETLSGFKENLKYGLGGNAMTGGQKGNLIFGGLFVGFLIFMSGYLLE